MQHSQRRKRMQQLVGLEQEHGMAGSTTETLLLCGVRLVNQMSAGLESGSQSREEFALKKEKDQHQVVLFVAKVLRCIEIADLGRDGSRRQRLPGVFFRLLDADFR